METFILILIGAMVVVAVIANQQQKSRKEQEQVESRKRRREETERRSLEHFDAVRIQHIPAPEPEPLAQIQPVSDEKPKPKQVHKEEKPSRIGNPAVQKPQGFQSSDLEPYYENIDKLNIPTKSLLKDKIKRENGKFIAVLRFHGRSDYEAAKEAKKGDKVFLKKTGKVTVAMLNESKKRIGTVEMNISRHMANIDLNKVKCVIAKATLSKKGDMVLTAEITVDAIDFAKVEFPELARWDPLSSDHFWLSLNNVPFGRRKWKKKSGDIIPAANYHGYKMDVLAGMAAQELIENRRFKTFPDEDNLNSREIGKVFARLRGLDYRSNAAQIAASELQMRDLVVVVKDSYNGYDENALAVFTISGLHIGYIDRETAETLSYGVWDIFEAEIIGEFPDITMYVYYVKQYV